jgi:Na+-driven multidrug efflux pump
VILSIIIIAFANPLLSLMATDKAIIEASAIYIRVESVASIFSLVFNFIMVGMVTLGKEKYVYVLTAVKLVLCLLVDTFMVSTLPISLNLGVNGIAFSNIIVNFILVCTSIILLNKEGITLFNKAKLSFEFFFEKKTIL